MKFFSLKNHPSPSHNTSYKLRFMGGIWGWVIGFVVLSVLLGSAASFADEVAPQGSAYTLAIQKYIRGEHDEALLILEEYENNFPEDINPKAFHLKKLILKKAGMTAGRNLSGQYEYSDASPEMDMYFHMAFRKYVEGDFAKAHEFLKKHLQDHPHSQKAKKLLQVVQKREEGFLDESIDFVTELFEGPLGDGILSQANEEDLYSVNFKNEPLQEALYTLSELYGANIVADNNLDVTVTARLTGANLQDALRAILSAVDLSYLSEGDVIRVVDKAQYRTTKLFDLENISLIDDKVHTDDSGIVKENLIDKITLLLTSEGKVLYDELRRTLLVTDTLLVLDSIEKFLKHVDVFEPQILIEARIIQITPSVVNKIGIDWSVLDAYAVGLTSPSFTYAGSKARTSTPAVDIDVTDTAGVITTDTRTDRLDQSVVKTLTKTLSANLTPANFQLVLSALKTDTDAKLLASPNVLTRAGEEAHLSIGEQQPIPEYTFNTETGALEISGFDYKDIGVIMTVVAYPVEDDYVSMVVLPEVSKKTDESITFGGATNTTIPIISSTKVKTQAYVKSGHTLAIGGLMREDSTITQKKVPFLGDLPFIDRFFKHEVTDISLKNIIIFLTTTVVTKENMDNVTAIQSQPLGEDYALPLPISEEKKTSWGNIPQSR